MMTLATLPMTASMVIRATMSASATFLGRARNHAVCDQRGWASKLWTKAQFPEGIGKSWDMSNLMAAQA
eukprot:4221478-Pleurochrysis_carterae.AAC.2